MITLPVSASMYQSMMANIQQIHTNSDGTVCITPMQVDVHNNNNNSSNANANINNGSNNGCNSNSIKNSNSEDGSSNNGNANGVATATTASPQFQCYSVMTATPLVTATAHRLLANTALNQTQNLVNNLNLNSNSNSGSTNTSNISPNNIRCQIINASSLQQNSSQMNCQQQQQQQQNYLANVLQNATAKVFVTNPAHLNLTAATNLFSNTNNNNNDSHANNNNHPHINSNSGHLKFATALPLPIVVATAAQRRQLVKEEKKRNGSNRKSPFKRRKQAFAKVIPIKVEKNVSTNAAGTSTSSAGGSLLNIQIVNTANSAGVAVDAGNVDSGGDNNSDGVGVIGGLGNLKVGSRLLSVDVSTSTLSSGSQMPAKTIKLETVDNQ